MDSPKAFPIDQYLIVDRAKAGIINILDGDEWSWEPALKPEDEIMLKRLHTMLQSTAEDLRDLSKEILSSRQNGVQIMTQPTPLDEEFNEKVHIKEAVDAKFNGRILVDKKGKTIHKIRANKNVINKKERVIDSEIKVNTGVQVNLLSKDFAKIEKLSATPVLNEKNNKNLSNSQIARNRPSNAVRYEELLHETFEPKVVEYTPTTKCVVQEMPSVEIRSQLSEQKVVNLNILPDDSTNKKPFAADNNTAVIAVQHDTMTKNTTEETKPFHPVATVTRKIARLPRYESSESNVKSNSESDIQISNVRASKINKPQRNVKNKINAIIQKEKDEQKKKMSRKQTTTHRMSDEWRQRLNIIYGKPSTSNFPRMASHTKTQASASKNHTNFNRIIHKSTSTVKQNNVLNNAGYVPYSKLTLGGVNVSDIENEIGNVNNKADLPLSPILDKILSSQDNSRQQTPRRQKKHNLGPFSKSDENLLNEVLEIDRTINKTLNTKNLNKIKSVNPVAKPAACSIDGSIEDSYDDDFEEVEKSDQSLKTSNRRHTLRDEHGSDIDNENSDIDEQNMWENNETNSDKYEDVNAIHKLNIKSSNLSLKTAVDVFEYVHSVDTQDNATQSNATQKISLKETQTSPRTDANIQPIHNELWNAGPLDTGGEVEKMFKIEKDFIKNLIIEEYGDIFELQKNITKPTTYTGEKSKSEDKKNIAMQPKNTQTSPAHVKSMMTSPFKTKTRTTSPLPRSLTMQRQASPLVISNLDHATSRAADSDLDDAGITINLSSPRFNLRLPQSSHEVLSNLDTGEPISSATHSECKPKMFTYPQNKFTQTSKNRTVTSTESCLEETESDFSSLGEINCRFRRGKILRKENNSTSASSSCSLRQSSSDGYSGNMVPTKSDGEISLGQLLS